jgi:DNA mismatch repair protein MutS
MSVYLEYFKLQSEYEKKCGEKTVVIMQIGAHFEIFEYDPSEAKDRETSGIPCRIGKSREMAPLINCTSTFKDKSKEHSLSNPRMTGFPTVSYEKYRDQILSCEYTLVRVDQVKNDKEIVREVGAVLSPGTMLESSEIVNINNNFNGIVSFYIETSVKPSAKCIRNIENLPILCGMSYIDIKTGSNIIAETYSRDDDPLFPLHEAYRFLIANRPREIIVSFSYPKNNQDKAFYKSYLEHIRETLELRKYSILIVRENETPPDYFKVPYQQQFLSKIFFPTPSVSLSPKKVKLSILKEEEISGGETSLVKLKDSPSDKKFSSKVLTSPGGTIKIVSPKSLEELNLEMMTTGGNIAYLILLQYCIDHNETIVSKLSHPETNWLSQDLHLNLTHDAIIQLMIVDNSKKNTKTINSLFSVLDETSTLMGKRYLESMLLNPITDVDKLNTYYNCIDELIYLNSNTVLTLSSLEENLKEICDLDKFHRKVYLKILKPSEFVTLMSAYLTVIEIYKFLTGAINEYNSLNLTYVNLTEVETSDFNIALQEIFSQYNLPVLANYTIVDSKGKVAPPTQPFESQDGLQIKISDSMFSPFNPGVDSEIDAKFNFLKSTQDRLIEICNHLNTFLKDTRGKKLEFNLDVKKKKPNTSSEDSDDESSDVSLDYAFVTTASKGAKIKASPVNTSLCGKINVKNIGKNTIVTSSVIEELISSYKITLNQVEKSIYSRYLKTLNVLSSHHFFPAITRFITLLDFLKSGARVALKYKYCKPEISSYPSSFIKCKNMRHPVVERLISTQYIPNDVYIGKNENDPFGLLIYGVNSAGKSTYLRGVGNMIVMAQIGYYVAADELLYYPYTKIITRISGNDDIFKGDSSFVVEMKDVRTILRNADDRSLILIDELSKGTETLSATSLSVATILHLISVKSSFVISSHLHKLLEIPQIEKLINLENNSLSVYHLTTTYDPTTEMLIYDRKLSAGPGSSIYGLEVAKSLYLDPKFLQVANDVRKYLINLGTEFVSTKKSHFNSEVYVDECTLCHQKVELNSHHMYEQKYADPQGFIYHFHKDEAFNILILCESCHTKLHSSNKKISRSTCLNGSILSVSKK